MFNYIYYSFIIIVFVYKVFADLPDYVHLHTMEEIAETNYVLLDKFDICNSSENSSSGIIIAIKTSPMNRDQRNSLRKTWLVEVMKHRIPYVFVMGAPTDEKLVEKLLMEDKTHNDLLIGKPVDNYYNLTLKTIFVLAWAKTYCPTHWLLYVDDDSIVNIQKAIDFVASVKNETESAIYCYVVYHEVIRDRGSKWYVPISIWEPFYYPSYCYGCSYMIPPNTLFLLHQAATNTSTKPKLWIEDVYITGIVTEAVRITLIQSQSFFQCTAYGDIKLFNESVVLGHMGNHKELLLSWQLLRGKLTSNITVKPAGRTQMTKISRFNRQGYLLTTKAEKSAKLLEFAIEKYFSNIIHYSLFLGITFLTIMVFLRCKQRPFLGKFKFVGRSVWRPLKLCEKTCDVFKR